MSRIAKPVQYGDNINYTNPSDAANNIAVGDIVPLINFCAVAITNIKKGETGALQTNGVFQVPAVTDAPFSVGDIVYWDATAKKATKTGTNNVYLGVVAEAKAQAGATANVKLTMCASTTTQVTDGASIDYTHPADAAADLAEGDVVELTNMIGVAMESIAKGETGKVAVQGTFELTSDTGTAYSVGDKLYWNTTNHTLTKTVSTNIKVGFAVEAKASATATAKVLLIPQI